MKIFFIILFVVLVLAIILPYLNFQVYINALSNLGYIGELFGLLIASLVGVVDVVKSFGYVFTIILCACGLFVLSSFSDLF